MKENILAFIAVVATVAFLSGCVGMNSTQNPLGRGSLLDVGMNKSEVRNIMGEPVKSEFSGHYSAWHYCKTGISSANPTDEHMVAFFEGEQLTETQIYTVNLVDTGGATGDCSLFIRKVNWINAEKDGLSPVPAPSGSAVAGSCFFVSSSGRVVTSHHVISGKSQLTVIDNNGFEFNAVVDKSDPSNDLVVLKVNTQNHKYLNIAPFSSLKTGQGIFSVGYPVSAFLGTEVKFTDGVVSSTTGPQNMANMFQMTVPIQPGNSGSPVLNNKGQVVGIATSSAAIGPFLEQTGTLPQNVNWAIKSEYLSLLTGIRGREVSERSRQDVIDAAIEASCIINAL